MDNTFSYDYNPNRPINAEVWLALEEEERIAVVQLYHEKVGADYEGMRMHCMIQATVETQLAMKLPEVRAAFRKLRLKKVRRHDALHAIGNALANVIYNGVKGEHDSFEGNKEYHRLLKKIKPAEWKR